MHNPTNLVSIKKANKVVDPAIRKTAAAAVMNVRVDF